MKNWGCSSPEEPGIGWMERTFIVLPLSGQSYQPGLGKTVSGMIQNLPVGWSLLCP